jgi:sigma-E factor negative regulatory protein RseC
MIETRVRVVSSLNGTAWVTAKHEAGCSACQSKSACGISGLGRFLSNRRPDLPIRQADGQVNAKAGDELLVCVDEAELLRAGLFAYLLPAVLAVVFAGVAAVFAFSDAAAAVSALLGLITGLLIARFLAPAPHLLISPIDGSISGEHA